MSSRCESCGVGDVGGPGGGDADEPDLRLHGVVDLDDGPLLDVVLDPLVRVGVAVAAEDGEVVLGTLSVLGELVRAVVELVVPHRHDLDPRACPEQGITLWPSSPSQSPKHDQTHSIARFD